MFLVYLKYLKINEKLGGDEIKIILITTVHFLTEFSLDIHIKLFRSYRFTTNNGGLRHI